MDQPTSRPKRKPALYVVPPATPGSAPAAASAPTQVRLSAQVLTCLVLCMLAAAIIHFRHIAPAGLFARPLPLMWQLMIGHGLALVAAAGAWLLYRFTAESAATARTVQNYARLDLEGMNPLWMSICAAVGEELLFRAALQPLLGLWIASVVFLLTHTPVYRLRQFDRATLSQAAGVFGVGLVLGLVFQYVGLLAAMLVHAWIDIVGLLTVRTLIRMRP